MSFSISTLTKPILTNIESFLSTTKEVLGKTKTIPRLCLIAYQSLTRLSQLDAVLENVDSGQLTEVKLKLEETIHSYESRITKLSQELGKRPTPERVAALERRLGDLEQQQRESSQLQNVTELFDAIRTMTRRSAQLSQAKGDALENWYRSWLPDTEQSKQVSYPEIIQAFLNQQSSRDLAGEAFLSRILDKIPLRLLHVNGSAYLGKGGHAVVYRAVNEQFDDRNIKREIPVAVKVLISSDPEALEKFSREADRVRDVHAQLGEHGSPAIIRFHTSQALLFPIMVTECFEGVTLKKYLEVRERPSIEHRLFIVYQILDACQVAAERLVVHGDLSPTNVLISDNLHNELPIVKVIDYGVARKIRPDAGEQTKTLEGTDPYIATEIRDHNRANADSDLYSLGKIMILDLFPVEEERPEVVTTLIKRFVALTGDRGTAKEAKSLIASVLAQTEEGRLDDFSEAVERALEHCREELVEIQKVQQKFKLRSDPQLDVKTHHDDGQEHLGDPVDLEARITDIRERHIDFVRSPYRIAFMGLFSSGKTLLINKLLTHILLTDLQRYDLAEYEAKPEYLKEDRYKDDLAPYLRRSTAEPTDTVVTLIRYAQEGDEELQKKAAELIKQGDRAKWPTDNPMVHLPLCLAPLQEHNLVDTPGLNEKNQMDTIVKKQLQTSDLIVYLFKSTDVMNRQDIALLREKYSHHPNKRILFVVNMIDTLIDRTTHTCFWEDAQRNRDEVARQAAPLKGRIETGLKKLTGQQIELKPRENFWVVSSWYNYQVKELWEYLSTTARELGDLDRLRDTPDFLKQRESEVRKLCQYYLQKELRPRLKLYEEAAGALATFFTDQLWNHCHQRWDEWLAEYRKSHSWKDERYLKEEYFEGTGTGPALSLVTSGFLPSGKPVTSWSQLLKVETGSQNDLWHPELKRNESDYPLWQLVKDLVEGDSQHEIWQRFGKVAIREPFLTPLLKRLDEAISALQKKCALLKNNLEDWIDELARKVKEKTSSVRNSCEEQIKIQFHKTSGKIQFEISQIFGGIEREEPEAERAIHDALSTKLFEKPYDQNSEVSRLKPWDHSGYLARLSREKNDLLNQLERDQKELTEKLETQKAEVEKLRDSTVESLHDPLRGAMTSVVFTKEHPPETETEQTWSMKTFKTLTEAVIESESQRRRGWRILRLLWIPILLLSVWLGIQCLINLSSGFIPKAGLILILSGNVAYAVVYYRRKAKIEKARAQEEALLREAFGRLVKRLDDATRKAFRETLQYQKITSKIAHLKDVESTIQKEFESLRTAHNKVREPLQKEAVPEWMSNISIVAQQVLAPFGEYQREVGEVIEQLQGTLVRISPGGFLASSIAFFQYLSMIHGHERTLQTSET